jgi:CIC family chloride channel protein
MKIDELVQTNFVIIQASKSAREASRMLADNKTSEGYCVSENGALLGKLSLQELVAKENLKSIQSILERNPVYLTMGSSVETAREIAADFVGESMPVIDPKTKKLIGLISESDIFRAVLKTQKEVNSLEKT